MFLNREEAGIRLASKVARLKNVKAAIVVAIPRGGVVVGKVISLVLQIPFSALLVKKIGAPANPELAIGATGSDSIVYWDEEIIKSLKMSHKNRKQALKKTVETIREKEKSLGIKPPDVKGKSVILVDDGVATGATAIAASLILAKLGTQKIILATPVISKRTKNELKKYFDKIVAVETPNDFQAVGEFYQEFPQVEDEEVKKLLTLI